MNIKRLEDENEHQYIWRLCEAKEDGMLVADWKQLGSILNKELYSDETEYKDESAFRKSYQYAKMYYEDVFKNKIDDDNYLKEIRLKTEELKKERFRLSDERTEYNKKLRGDSRLEDRLDRIEKIIQEQGKEQFNNEIKHNIIENSDNDLLVILSDLHMGQTFDSFNGIYNSDIAKKRMFKYEEEIIRIAHLNNSQNCYISLQGDMISNSIHKSLAISNRENVIEQIILASELVSNFVYRMSTIFNKVIITSVSGNHSRLDTKDDSLKDERLDDLVIWYLKSKVSHIKNIKINDNIDSTFAIMNIRGKEYVNLHGDYDSFTKQGVANISMMIGHFPYAITFGHLHTCAMSEEGGVKLIRGGCFAGSGDDYTIQKRLVGSPTQMVCVCNKKGIESYYEVSLD